MRLYNSCRQFAENHMICKYKCKYKNQFFHFKCVELCWFWYLFFVSSYFCCPAKLINSWMCLLCVVMYVLELLNFFSITIPSNSVQYGKKVTLMRNVHVKMYSITRKWWISYHFICIVQSFVRLGLCRYYFPLSHVILCVGIQFKSFHFRIQFGYFYVFLMIALKMAFKLLFFSKNCITRCLLNLIQWIEMKNLWKNWNLSGASLDGCIIIEILSLYDSIICENKFFPPTAQSQ